MKSFVLILLLSAGISGLKAKSLDSATVVIFGKSYTIHVGDTLKLGYGSNPDGSFMYITGMDKSGASKTVVIKSIRYFRSLDLTEIRIKGKGINHMAQIPQAFEKMEIVSINGVTIKSS
jgi:hypothetical protein